MDQRQFYKRRFRMVPVFIVAAVLLMGAVVRLLWNEILPPLLNVNPITYWQSVGLLILCRILFGNFGGRPGQGRFGGWNGGKGNGQQFGQAWRNRWMQMSEEDRARLKQEMRQRCGGRPPKNPD